MKISIHNKLFLLFGLIAYGLFFLSKPFPVWAVLEFTELGSVVDSTTINASLFGLPTEVGDINGDGYQDLVVAAKGVSTNQGRIYVFFGGSSLDTTADIIIDGEAASDFFPTDSLNFDILNIDNDGYADIVAGAGGNDDNGSAAGKGYIIFGSSSLSGSYVVDLMPEVVSFLGNTTSKKLLGVSQAVGDFNGDGYKDVAFAAPYANSNAGTVEIYFGNGTKSFDTTADKTLSVSSSTQFGYNGMKAGDVNGDGYDDLVAGEYWSNQGEVYLFYGGADMDVTYDVKFVAKATNDYLTRDALDVQDIDNDGYADICLGAYLNDTPASNAGRVYCFFGSASLSGTKNVDTDADLIFSGAVTNDNFGRALSFYDFNNDGYRDLIVGAHQDSGNDNGYTDVFLGNGTRSFDTTTDFTISAASIGESAQIFGNGVNAGDMDNDGWADLFVTSAKGGNGTGNSGRTHIFEVNHGTPSLSLNSLSYTSSSLPTLTGTATDTVNLTGVQWSTANSASGTWTDCTANDGSFNSLSEGFSCPMTSTLSEGSNRTIYFRTYDTNSVYMPLTSYGSLVYTYDSTSPATSWTSSDNAARIFSSAQANVLSTVLNLPSFSFTKSKDTGSGVSKYQILIKKEKQADGTGNQYDTYIDDIPHNNVSGTVLDDTNRYVRYTDDDILVHSKKETDKLANGGYKWKVRVIDKAGNSTDTEEKILLINTHSANFSGTWLPLVLFSKSPSFYGITTMDTKVTLSLKQNGQTIFAKQTIANPESRFGINIDKSDNLAPGIYNALLSAINLRGDYIEIPEFKFTYGKKILPTAVGVQTSQPIISPTPESTPTPKPQPEADRPLDGKHCFLFWCW